MLCIDSGQVFIVVGRILFSGFSNYNITMLFCRRFWERSRKVLTYKKPQNVLRHLHVSHNAPYLRPKILLKHCFKFLLGRLLKLLPYPGKMKKKGYATFLGGGGQIRFIMGDMQVAYRVNQMNSQANYNTTNIQLIRDYDSYFADNCC